MKTMGKLLFDRKIEVDDDERRLCLKCARAAMRRLRKDCRLDGFFSPLRGNDQMWCLSSYALFLREVAAGRIIRYRKLTEIAASGASVMGDGRVLEILERNGVDVPSTRWTWRGLTPFTLAAISGADKLARELLKKYPALPEGEALEWNLRECARYASPTLVEAMLGHIGMMFPQDGERWRELLGMALFSAVAGDRRETIALVMRLGADGALSRTDGFYPAHCGSSLFSCAVDNGNFEFADICLALDDSVHRHFSRDFRLVLFRRGCRARRDDFRDRAPAPSECRCFLYHRRLAFPRTSCPRKGLCPHCDSRRRGSAADLISLESRGNSVRP